MTLFISDEEVLMYSLVQYIKNILIWCFNTFLKFAYGNEKKENHYLCCFQIRINKENMMTDHQDNCNISPKDKYIFI